MDIVKSRMPQDDIHDDHQEGFQNDIEGLRFRIIFKSSYFGLGFKASEMRNLHLQSTYSALIQELDIKVNMNLHLYNSGKHFQNYISQIR